MAVKKAVQCGNVEDAIEKVNDLNPEVGYPFFSQLLYDVIDHILRFQYDIILCFNF